jgi:hypothetical protein
MPKADEEAERMERARRVGLFRYMLIREAPIRACRAGSAGRWCGRWRRPSTSGRTAVRCG